MTTWRELVEDRMVAVPNGELFVRTWLSATSTNQEPLILLHDSLGCVDLWRDFPKLLAQHLHRPIVAYDRLGFGRSTPRHDILSTDFIREEATIYVPALCQALNISDYCLFGHSVGGSMAFTTAAHHPDQCRAVISVATQAFVEQRTIDGILAAKAQFQDPQQMQKLHKLHGDKAQWVLNAWTETWLSSAFATWNLQATLNRVTCPILVIHGDSDEYGSLVFPQKIAEWTAGLAEVQILTNCGHIPQRERPHEVLQYCAAFFDRGVEDRGVADRR